MVSDETRSNGNALLLSATYFITMYARMDFVFLNSSFNQIINV